MSAVRTKANALNGIEQARQHWLSLVADVGDERMEQPGAMGEWTFKDLAAHLTAWRDWSIVRIEAGPGRTPSPIWPRELTRPDPNDPDETDWDPINEWFRERDKNRPVRDVLADAEMSFDRLRAAVEALPEEDVITPGRFQWLGDYALADADFGGHLTDEHEPAVRAWLTTQRG